MKISRNDIVAFAFGAFTGSYLIANTPIGLVLAGLMLIWLKLRQMEDAAAKK